MEGQGQEMESSVPFLSPFPSINSSQSSSSGTLITIPITQPDSHRTEHSHHSQIATDKGGEVGDDMPYEVDIDGRDLVPNSRPGPRPMHSTEHNASAAHTFPPLPPIGEEGCKSSVGRDPVDPAKSSPVSGTAATTCPSVKGDEVVVEVVHDMAGSTQQDRVGAVTPIENSGMTAKVSSRFSSSLDFLLGESSSSVKKGMSRAVDLRDLKGSSSFIDGPLRSRDAAVIGVDDFEGSRAVTLTAPLHAASTSTTTSTSKEVGDRLLRIAEDLLSVKYVAANSIDAEAETETATLIESLKAESRVRTDTAKKLLLLSKILSGRASMEDYSAFN